jgi:RNAse (barnase) inhibitor barstar
MSTLQPLFAGELTPGVYQLTSRAKPENVIEEVTEQGWRGFYVDGAAVTDKSSFLDAFAVQLGFPSYFGHNWDAFEECITEMTWAPGEGYVILWDEVANFADAAPEQWETVQAILAQAANYWAERGVPFYVLMRGTRHHGRDIPNL